MYRHSGTGKFEAESSFGYSIKAVNMYRDRSYSMKTIDMYHWGYSMKTVHMYRDRGIKKENWHQQAIN